MREREKWLKMDRDEGSGIFRPYVWDTVKIRTESAAQETPLINRARYFFFFFFYFTLVRLAPPPSSPPPITPPLAPSRVSRFLPRPCFRSAFPRSPLHSSRSPYPFLWKFPVENILPLPRDEIRVTLKNSFTFIPFLEDTFEKYLSSLSPSSQDLFREIKKNINVETFINF